MHRLIAFRRSQPHAPRLREQAVTVRGLRMAVFTTPPVPDAIPLACVNGGLLYGHDLLWPALAPLAARRQLIFYDQRGRGASQPPNDPSAARIEDDAADLAALRAALGLSRWDVLGHSWGAGVAMLGVERDRASARRLVLVDSVGPTSEWMKSVRDAALARLLAGGRAALERIGPTQLASPDPTVHSAYSRALFPAWFAERALAEFVPLPRSTSETGAALAARLWREGYDWRLLLRAVNTPSLVLHGERDLLPITVAHDLAALLPNAALTIIANTGHLPFLEAPEEFFALAEEFLSVPSPSR